MSFYTKTGAPSDNSSLSSATIRAEFALIETAMNKLPTLSGAGNRAIFVNAGGTALESVAAATARSRLGVVVGTDVQAWDANLDQIAALAVTDGNFMVGNGSAWVAESGATARTSLGLAIGTDVQAWDADLDALAALSSTGIAARTASNTWAQRTLTGTAAEITVTNGDGVSGNPTLSLPTALTFTGKTVTGGSFASPTLSGTVAGTPTVSGAWTFQDTLTVTDSVAEVGGTQINLRSPQGGYGVGILGESPLITSGALKTLGKITFDGEAAWDSASVASQDAYLDIYLTENGTLASKATLSSAGLLNTVGGYTANGVAVPTNSSTSTFTNKTLTSPTINGGTIDGATIGGTTPGAGTFNALTVAGNAAVITAKDNDSTGTTGSVIYLSLKDQTDAELGYIGYGEAISADLTIRNSNGNINLSSSGGTPQANGSAILVSGGALGTPSSGTLTNCTGLPVSGLVDVTATAAQINAAAATNILQTQATYRSSDLTNQTGTQDVISLAVTPKSTSSYLLIEGSLPVAFSVNGETPASFIGSLIIANNSDTVLEESPIQFGATGTGDKVTATVSYMVVSGSTDARTYKLRFSEASADTEFTIPHALFKVTELTSATIVS